LVSIFSRNVGLRNVRPLRHLPTLTTCKLRTLRTLPTLRDGGNQESVCYGACSAYLTNIVESVSAGQTCSWLRSTSSTDFTLPRLSTKFTERAFSHAAWNALHQDPRDVVDPAKFRRQSKTHYFTPAFNLLCHSEYSFYVLNVLCMDYCNAPTFIL